MARGNGGGGGNHTMNLLMMHGAIQQHYDQWNNESVVRQVCVKPLGLSDAIIEHKEQYY